MSTVFANVNPRGICVCFNLEVGNTFLILSYFVAKLQTFFPCGAIPTVTLLLFDLSFNLVEFSLAMHYVAYSYLPACRAQGN